MKQEINYRDNMLSYAKGGIRSTLVVNGAAAIAVLSQLHHLPPAIPLNIAGLSVFLFTLNIGLGMLLWIIAFESTRRAALARRNKAARTKARDYRRAGAGVILLIIAIFLISSALLIIPLLV